MGKILSKEQDCLQIFTEMRETPFAILWGESRIVLNYMVLGDNTVVSIGSLDVKLRGIEHLDKKNSVIDYLLLLYTKLSLVYS